MNIHLWVIPRMNGIKGVKMEKVYITSAVRTPVGSFMGVLSSLSAPKLGAIAIKEAVERSKVPTSEITECIFGEVLTAGVGQAPARQALIYAGLPHSVGCMTINKVCGSGLKSVMLANDMIRLNPQAVVIAGGQESMSNSPHLLEGSRNGFRMGNAGLTDSMVKDGLWDPYKQWHMGNAAELCVKEMKFTREEQDHFATESYKKAIKAQTEGLFKNEIVVVKIEDKKGTTLVEKDEEPGNVKFDKIAGLRPAFDKDGTVTAANASKINDGAAALVLMSESKLQSLKPSGTKALAQVITHATYAQAPEWFTTAPVGAIKKALELANLKVEDIDLWEINEAFSVVSLAAIKELSIPIERVNIHGGAVAIGHPIGASGARILTTLVHALKTTGKKRGLATLCIGGGEAVALIIEAV
jgi:acetyl-CoA C-acetyltransferase